MTRFHSSEKSKEFKRVPFLERQKKSIHRVYQIFNTALLIDKKCYGNRIQKPECLLLNSPHPLFEPHRRVSKKNPGPPYILITNSRLGPFYSLAQRQRLPIE